MKLLTTSLPTKLLPSADRYYVGMDLASSRGFTVIERWRVEWNGPFYHLVECVSRKVILDRA